MQTALKTQVWFKHTRSVETEAHLLLVLLYAICPSMIYTIYCASDSPASHDPMSSHIASVVYQHNKVYYCLVTSWEVTERPCVASPPAQRTEMRPSPHLPERAQHSPKAAVPSTRAHHNCIHSSIITLPATVVSPVPRIQRMPSKPSKTAYHMYECTTRRL